MRATFFRPMIALACLVSVPAFALGIPPAWPGYGNSPQHGAISGSTAQPLNHILWSTPVDLAPQFSGNDLLIHYGSPLVTAGNNVIVTVKTTATGGFRLESHDVNTGAMLWRELTDYVLPSHNWTPSCGSTISSALGLVTPAAGGSVLSRRNPDDRSARPSRIVFYNNRGDTSLDLRYRICTPITADGNGNVYFGFRVEGSSPAATGGFAKISFTGFCSYVMATDISGTSSVNQVEMNCAPAISNDNSTVYIAVNSGGFSSGYLVALDSRTLAVKSRIHLDDPSSGNSAIVPDDGTSSPLVGPDGDVYFGVLENPFGSNHARGWLLHFDGDLAGLKNFGAFGWDDTPSIVASSAVSSYLGSSPYLLLTKYNNYAGAGGDGVNCVAILDPNVTAVEPVSGKVTMKEVIKVKGPTPDSEFIGNHPNAVREWCINSAVVDIAGQCAIVNNEDGSCYRWDFNTNTLTQSLVLTGGVGEAYTPTIMARGGVSFAINNATLYALGQGNAPGNRIGRKSGN